MNIDTRSHVAGLSLSNTVELLNSLGVKCSRKAVHDWVQKADLQLGAGKLPDQITLDETVIGIRDQQFRVYTAAADPQANELFFIACFRRRPTSQKFFRELR